MNPDLFSSGTAAAKMAAGMENQYAALLQQHQAAVVAAAAAQLSASLPAVSAGSSGQMTPPSSGSLIPSGSKRKHEVVEDDEERGGGGGGCGGSGSGGGGTDGDGQPRDKRLRTTILPEQLDFLYQQYQLESNPSRKMLETISREVGLKKRVVQVWFQNTRARERKGQFRAHAQVINKRCPFCPALFKVNIDALPDMTDEDSDTGMNLNTSSSPHLGSSHSVQSGSTSAAGEANSAAAIQEALTKRLSAVSNYQQSMASLSMLSSLYSQGFVAPLPGFEGKAEDALKRYATDYLANAGNNNATPTPAAATNEQRPSTGNPTGELPLDLSRPLPLQQGLGQVRPESAMQSDVGTDDNRSEHYMDYFDESNPSSPLPYSKMGGGGNQSNSGNASMTGSASGGQNKRFRTQMSAVQVRVMKSLFSDYKTPTMAECEALGREIGLPKRVVQVWFQNARAKEKKNKLNAQKAAGDLSGIESNLGTKQPEGCDLCDFKYSHKYAVQDHIFTHQHIERVKIHVAEQSGKHSDDMPTTVARPSKGGHQQESQEPSTPTPVGGSSAEMTTSPPNSNATESAQLEALLLHQLYGMGYGAAGVPAAALAAAAAAAAASSSYNNSQQQSSTNVMAGGES
jgi:AT-binding transcription factor 1